MKRQPKQKQRITKRIKLARTNKRDVVIYGIEGALAAYGYFTPQVQRVIKRWRGRIPQWLIDHYFSRVSAAALWRERKLDLQVDPGGTHWPFIWELAAAVEMVRSIPNTHPTHWLLRLSSVHRLKNGAPDLWKEIGWEIKQKGGPGFSAFTLRQAAKRLHLVSPPGAAPAAFKASPAAF